MRTTMYLLTLRSPTRMIQEVSCNIIVSKKTIWTLAADVPVTEFKGRHLVGTSAFFSLAAARRAQLGLLTLLSKKPINIFNYRGVHQARHLLDHFPTGDFPCRHPRTVKYSAVMH